MIDRDILAAQKSELESQNSPRKRNQDHFKHLRQRVLQQ